MTDKQAAVGNPLAAAGAASAKREAAKGESTAPLESPVKRSEASAGNAAAKCTVPGSARQT